MLTTIHYSLTTNSIGESVNWQINELESYERRRKKR